jgi:putative photosynthetic complex assembly protein
MHARSNARRIDPTLPRGALIGAAILVGAAIIFVAAARLSGYRPEQPPPSRPVTSLALQFEDRADGAVLVYAGSQLVDTLPPGSNGFVRGVLRGFARGRRADGVGRSPPFRLTRWADGRLSLDDPETGRHVDLEVFGPTNAGAFAQILIASSQARSGS